MWSFAIHFLYPRAVPSATNVFIPTPKIIGTSHGHDIMSKQWVAVQYCKWYTATPLFAVIISIREWWWQLSAGINAHSDMETDPFQSDELLHLLYPLGVFQVTSSSWPGCYRFSTHWHQPQSSHTKMCNQSVWHWLYEKWSCQSRSPCFWIQSGFYCCRNFW